MATLPTTPQLLADNLQSSASELTIDPALLQTPTEASPVSPSDNSSSQLTIDPTLLQTPTEAFRSSPSHNTDIACASKRPLRSNSLKPLQHPSKKIKKNSTKEGDHDVEDEADEDQQLLFEQVMQLHLKQFGWKLGIVKKNNKSYVLQTDTEESKLEKAVTCDKKQFLSIIYESFMQVYQQLGGEKPTTRFKVYDKFCEHVEGDDDQSDELKG